MSEWINAEERLPEDQADCLIAVPSFSSKTRELLRTDVFHANFWAENKLFASCEEGDFFEGEYTHWMPIPDPPKEQS